MSVNGIPTLQETKALLEEAAKLNPGLWAEHSIYAAKAAHLNSIKKNGGKTYDRECK